MLIDDGSTDGTETVAYEYQAKDSRIKYYKRPETYKPGGNGARNFGLDLSKGEFVNWFDNDDVMLPEFLADKAVAFNPSLQFVISSHRIVDSQLNVLKTVNLKVKDYVLKDYIFWRENFCIVTANVLFRKEFLLNNNYRFNEEIKRGQEAELFSRMFSFIHPGDYKIINRPGYLYRQHADTKSAANSVFNYEYRANHIFINMRNLDYAIQNKDFVLRKYILSQILFTLFLARRNSKDLYKMIVVQLAARKRDDLKWQMKILLLKFYGYMPVFSRIDSFVKKKAQQYVS